jgi:hypothetical protein
MALIKCKECSKGVSSEAEKCPHCGITLLTAIRCKNCNSTNVEKISNASKVGNALMWGVFAGLPKYKAHYSRRKIWWNRLQIKRQNLSAIASAIKAPKINWANCSYFRSRTGIGKMDYRQFIKKMQILLGI